jgi:putative oxidoreductase
MDDALDPLARLLLAGTFLVSAFDKSVRPTAAMAEIRALEGHTKVPLPAPLVLAGVLAAQWVGGLALLLPATASFGALVLLAFLAPVTLVAHQFWAAPPAKRKEKLDHFLANAAIAGGLVLVATGSAA